MQSTGEEMNMRKKSLWSCFMLAALIVLVMPLTRNAGAQSGAAGSGKIHGVITDPSGAPAPAGTVTLYAGGLNSPNQDSQYSFPVDANGNFKGDNVKAGSYSVIFRAPDTPKDKVLDQLDNVQVTAGQDTLADFDMSRQAYLDKLTPAERKAIAETRAKNAAILKENSTIKNLNGDLGKARQDDKDKNFADAAALMQKDANIKPDAAVLWVELGIAQAGLKQWADAETNLQKGITMDQAAKKPDANMEGAAQDKLGESYAVDGKIPEALAAYDAAAKINPAGAGLYYENETIMMDRQAQTVPAAADAIVPSADKAIAADPNRPIPYYLKGRALVAKATIDPKTQKIVAPPGCEESYEKYLQLAPTGPFAGEAKQILAEMAETQSTSYKGKKH
jgi:tetratricopeptide (TPR) repeat protein